VPLFTRHPAVLQAAFSEMKRVAQQQPLLLTGTPGSLDAREMKGRVFYYRQFYDAEGVKATEYIGPAGRPEVEERAAAVRRAIELAQLLVRDARLLSQLGYVRADKRTAAILAALANHAVFAAGALLVGSNAYGALLNELGVKAAAFATEDVDIARNQRLQAELLRVDGADFEKILAESTVRLAPVPVFGRGPSTSYAALSGRLSVDLLVPSGGDDVSVKRVPELKAYAQAIPHLRHLLVAPIDAVVLGHNGVVPVRVPRPEAYAWHKVRLSQTPSRPLDKRRKDAAQAAVLLGVLAEDAPDALKENFKALSATGKVKTRAAAGPIIELLRSDHARAAEIVSGVVAP
jgi:hypothetical protein